MATYHVKHRYGFVGDYEDLNKIVTDCNDAVMYSRSGAQAVAAEINRKLANCHESNRRAQTVMLTANGKVRIVHDRDEVR